MNKLFLKAGVVSLCAVALFAFSSITHAATRTWDGGAVDNNLASATNWSTDVAPVAGDDLIFPANVTDVAITNDFTAGTSFNSLAFTGTATQNSRYTISGNSIALVGGINSSVTSNNVNTIDSGAIISLNITISANQTISTVYEGGMVTISGVISGSGNIIKSGSGILILDATNTYTGTTDITQGEVWLFNPAGLGATIAGTTIRQARMLFQFGNVNATVSEPFTLSNDCMCSRQNFLAEIGYGPLEGEPDKTITLNGSINVTESTDVFLSGINMNMTNVTFNGTDIGLTTGSFGTLTINGQARPAADPELFEYFDSQPSQNETVTNNDKFVINGQRNDVSVYYDGILSGSGTVDVLTLRNGATFAPGTSPGCMNTGNLAYLSGSTTEIELAGTTVCTQYDQIRVTGTVSLNGALSTLLLSNFKPTVGNIFTIITNDGADAVSGTFTSLPEGATFSVSGYVFKISYVGGTGNDVVLTVQSVPSTPNTGFGLSYLPLMLLWVIAGIASSVVWKIMRTRST